MREKSDPARLENKLLNLHIKPHRVCVYIYI